MSLLNLNALPGFQPLAQSEENQVWFGHENLRLFDPLPVIGAAAVDAANTPTTTLRNGLVLAKKTADGLWYEYDPTQTDGREVAAGVLIQSLSMLNIVTGVVSNKNGRILVGGLLKASALIGLDRGARRQLASRFTFDDDFAGADWGGGFKRELAKAANYAVVAADNNTEFVATAAAVFTLPAIGKGYRFKFRNQADTNMGVASAEGTNMVALNNAGASSVTFSTAGQKIGGAVIVYSNKAGDKWIVENASAGANTITVA